MRRNSLRARLLLTTVLLIVVVLPATAFVLATYYRHSIERAFDARLKVHLDNLVAISLRQPVADEADSERPPISLGDPQFDRPFSGWYWQIRQVGDGVAAALGSDSLLDQRLPALPDDSALDADDTARGYVRGPDNQLLRLIQVEIAVDAEADAGQVPGESSPAAGAGAGSTGVTATDVATHYLYSVAALAEEVEQQVRQFRQLLLLALGILAAVLIGAAVLQVGYGLRPLAEMSRRLNAIRTGKADRLAGPFPQEIEPLQQELNALLRANREIVERARTHVGNLAHALKTPLSVIGNEVDRARASGGEASVLAERIARQAELMRDQVRHHLDRARMAAQSGVIGNTTDVAEVATSLLRTLGKIHQQRAVEAEFTCVPGLLFRGERHDLEEMLGNLLDNAFRWASKQVRLDVSDAKAGSGHFVVTVEDDGPGLSDVQQRQALQRGRRLDEASPGSGLGLAIVADLVALYGGSLDLGRSPQGGLQVRLLLPREPV